MIHESRNLVFFSFYYQLANINFLDSFFFFDPFIFLIIYLFLSEEQDK